MTTIESVHRCVDVLPEVTLVGGTLLEFDRRGNAPVSATSTCTTLATMPPFVSFRCARQPSQMGIKEAKMPTTALLDTPENVF